MAREIRDFSLSPLEVSRCRPDNQCSTADGGSRVIAIVEDIPMQPIALGDFVADSPEALAALKRADSLVEEQGLVDADVRSEFMLSCDALNYARVAWRCAVEWGTRGSMRSSASASGN